MFSMKISLLANSSVRQSFSAVRTYRNVKIKQRARKSNNGDSKVKGNPGGDRMLSMILDGESPDISDVTLEDIDNSENDMINSHLFYDQHKKEMNKQKEIKFFHNIKRKYFKNNTVTPNFLTYFEKQQIKNLNQKSPKEWTPETLSTCFPASSEIIAKILKSKWTADEEQKILRHDKNVQENWDRFRNGSFNDLLSDELKDHLSKYSDRRPTLITAEQAKAHIPKPASDYLKPGEFGKIITSYHGEPGIQNEQVQVQIEAKEMLNNNNIYENELQTSSTKQHFTLDQLKNNFKKDSFSWYTPKNDHHKMPTNEKSVDAATIKASLQEHTSIISRKEVSNYVGSINDYPLAIRIPRRVWKEGYTYKVKDCFYDDKGDFLYRVPGLMTDEDSSKNQ